MSENLLKDLWIHRHVMRQLIVRDFKQRFIGSTLGLVWAFVQPLSMMAILWFVFTYGLKASAIGREGIPFVAWFFPAQIGWNFFQEGLLGGSSAVIDYGFLVKKVQFQTILLPIVKILSNMILHIVFLALLVVVLLGSGVMPQWSWFLVVYYAFAAVLLLIGIGWVTSSFAVFFRDVQQLLGVIAQFGFWATPIIWNPRALPPSLQPWLALNPVYYITEGYRNAFLGTTWEQFDLRQTIYFWIVTLSFIVAGRIIFKRLKTHFGDVL